MNLPFPIALAVEKAIESVLRMDPETRTRVASLNGKTIRVNLTSPPVSVLLSVVDGKILLGQPDDDSGLDQDADTSISGSFMALRSLLDGNDAVYTGQVIIEGDIGTSAQLKQIAAQLDPDWQDAISPYRGDGLTHRLDAAQSEFKRWFERTRNASRQNTSEYLQEEVELLAANSQIFQFCEEVDDVRAAADRLAARVQRLEGFTDIKQREN